MFTWVGKGSIIFAIDRLDTNQPSLASLQLSRLVSPPKFNTRVRKLTMRLELIVVEFGGVLHPLLGLPTAILVVQARVVVRYCRGRRLLHGSAPGPQLSAPHSTLCGENKLSLPLPPHNTYTTLTITLHGQSNLQTLSVI